MNLNVTSEHTSCVTSFKKVMIGCTVSFSCNLLAFQWLIRLQLTGIWAIVLSYTIWKLALLVFVMFIISKCTDFVRKWINICYHTETFVLKLLVSFSIYYLGQCSGKAFVCLCYSVCSLVCYTLVWKKMKFCFWISSVACTLTYQKDKRKRKKVCDCLHVCVSVGVGVLICYYNFVAHQEQKHGMCCSQTQKVCLDHSSIWAHHFISHSHDGMLSSHSCAQPSQSVVFRSSLPVNRSWHRNWMEEVKNVHALRKSLWTRFCTLPILYLLFLL